MHRLCNPDEYDDVEDFLPPNLIAVMILMERRILTEPFEADPIAVFSAGTTYLGALRMESARRFADISFTPLPTLDNIFDIEREISCEVLGHPTFMSTNA